MSSVYDHSQTDDIIFISRKDFEDNSCSSQTSSRRYPFVYLDMHSLNQFIDMPSKTYFQFQKDYQHDRMARSVINFNQLDYLDTEQSSQSGGQLTDVSHLKVSADSAPHTIKNNNNNNTASAYQHKSNSSSLTELYQNSNVKRAFKLQLKESQNTQNLDPYTLLKKKYMSKKHLRQQLEEQELQIDQATLTYYQRKKNFIEKMKEKDMLLDWDSMKKEDQLYESIHIGGASRNRKNKRKDDFEQTNSIIVNTPSVPLPQQSQQQKQNMTAPATATQSTSNPINLYTKEAKSYRKVPRSSRNEGVVENQMDEEKSSAAAAVVEKELREKESLHAKKEVDIFEGIEIELYEISTSELEIRKADFSHQQFLKEKYMNKSYIYISSKAQAAIPQIRPIQDVRNSWVLKDLDSLLTYKYSPEYESLDIYMSKFFGQRTPQQVFNILKQNKFSLQNSIDYCNYNSGYLNDYFFLKDQEAKKKLFKRKIEKK